jgi:hypothetical protein
MNRFFRGSDIQKGYGLGRRNPHQVGYGIGGLFSKFMNFMRPYLSRAKNFALPILKSGAESVGKEVVKTAAEIAKDLIDGKKFSESAEKHINSSVDSLGEKIEKTMVGKGYKRKQKSEKISKKVKSNLKKQKRVLDIFD